MRYIALPSEAIGASVSLEPGMLMLYAMSVKDSPIAYQDVSRPMPTRKRM